MSRIVVDNLMINYTDEGKGSALICLHGWMHDTESYAMLTDELSNEYRLVALDLPNFGKSQESDDIYTLDDYGEFLASFIKKVGLEDYSLVGHSMGGQIIINAIAKGYVKPQKLILIASAGIRDSKGVYKRSLKLFSKSLKHVIPKRIKKELYDKMGSDYNPDLSDIHKKIINQVLSTDILQEAKAISIPTLLIYGSEDTSTPLWMGKKLNDTINGSKLKVVQGGNHWVHQTSSGQVALYIKEFIDV